MTISKKTKHILNNCLILGGLLAVSAMPSVGYAAKASHQNSCNIVKDQSVSAKQRQLWHTLCCCYGVQVIHVGQTFRLVIPSKQLFNPDSANLRRGSAALLKKVTQFINTVTTEQVDVAAYSNRQPQPSRPNGRKLALTDRQAQVVISHLWQQGVNTRFIVATGEGRKKPVAWNGTKAGQAKNKRVEIRFYYYVEPKSYN